MPCRVATHPGQALWVLVAFVFFGCSTYNPIQISPNPQALAQCQQKRDCSASIQPGVEPSEVERCLLEIMRPRCDAVDKCFVDCIASGEGQNVGGGCFHLCEWVVTGVKGTLYKCPQQITPEWCACLGMEPNCGQDNAQRPVATKREAPGPLKRVGALSKKSASLRGGGLWRHDDLGPFCFDCGQYEVSLLGAVRAIDHRLPTDPFEVPPGV